MVNIKKQVIKTKIDSFLKRNELVLFYHYNSINRKDWNIVKSEIYKATPVSLLMSKNKIAQKAITFTINSNKDIYLSTIVSEFPIPGVLGQHSVPLDSSITSRIKESSSALHSKAVLTVSDSNTYLSPNSNNENLKKQTKKLFGGSLENSSLRGKAKQQNLQDSEVAKKNNFFAKCYSLFQGNTLLIGCQSTKELSALMQLLNKKSNFLLCGGVYQKQVINHIEVHRLVDLGDQVYNNLLQKIQNPLLPILSLKNQFHFFSLNYYQQKLIYILKSKAIQQTRH